MIDTSIVIVDDDAILRLDLRDLLQIMGYQVVGETWEARTAIKLAYKLRPDLVIMDVRLPGNMDGIDAAAELNARRIAPVLLLTGFSDPELIHRAAEAGAAGYTLKPFDEDHLRPAIEIALSHSRQIRSLEQKVRDLLEELETRKIVEHAKSMLMREHHLTEDEALSRMQKASDLSHKTMREVAEAVILAADIGA
ncbi:MAG: ANTAR domain-containing response regulator [Chloroflexia bacterium]